MAGKQIQFPENQTHKKSFEYAMIGFSLLCIVFAVICIQFVERGGW